MDVREYERIKESIERLKSKKAKAEGAIETIEASWKAQHGISTLKEAESLYEEMEKQSTALEEEVESLYTELKGVTNWALV